MNQSPASSSLAKDQLKLGERKMKFSKFKVLTMCLLIAIAAQGAFADSQCKDIFAVQQDRLIAEGCTSPIAFCAGGTFTGNHGFRGNFFFIALSFDQILTDPKPVHRQVVPGISKYTTDDGTLTISDVSVFDTERRTFAGIGYITEGTGRFAGATGDVFTNGRVSADGLSFTTDMTAQICFPN
jgi:hypothetical protein